MIRSLWLAVLTAALLSAQSERGNITGLVTDPSGAAVAGASVVVTSLATNSPLTVPTSSAGEFTAPNLSPGAYRMEVTAAGFKRYVQTSVTLTAGGTVRVDAQLQLGQTSEAIEIRADVPQLQTENAKVSTAVQQKMVDELPLIVGGAMRSPFNLVAVAAEAKGDGQRLSLGGGQAAAWDATLDGHSVGTNRSADAAEAALNSPSVEALTEFTIDTNGFKAEYGQAGGGVMTFVSKSGTNDYHGSVYDFLRNDALDARAFFAQKRSVYKQNDFGFTLGGPVIVPKLYNGRNKTFFFFAYEGFRNRVGANDTIRSVPTPEMYEGDFSKWVDQNNRLITIYDPTTQGTDAAGKLVREPFKDNIIPKSRFSALSRQILPFGQLAKPNRGGVPGTSAYVRNNFIVTDGTTTQPTNKWSIKGDQLLGSNHRLAFLYNTTAFSNKPGANGPPGLPLPLWDGQEQANDTKAYRVTHDWTVSSRLLNHFSFTANTFTKNSFSPNVAEEWGSRTCFKNVVDCNDNFPQVRFTEFNTWGGSSYNGTEQPGWGMREDLSFITGKHFFKFGYAFQSQRANGFGQQDISGRADFSFLSTGVPGETNFQVGGGSSFASFLLGDALFGRTETIRAVTQYYPYHGFFAQDDWRITRKLTLNLGVRYDVTLPPRSATDEYSDFTPDRPNPGADGFPGALRFAGFGQGRENTRSLVPGWFGGIGPRIGLAYSPDGKTTIRSGFGRSFSRVTAVQGSGHFAGFIGQYEFPNTNQGVTPTFNWDAGLPSYRLPPSIDPAFSNGNTIDWWQGGEATRAPENLNWTLSVQRQVSANLVMEIAYNANVGTHLQTGLLNFNQVPTRYLNQFVQQYGPAQAISLFNADINSPQARAANIPIPYPSFTTQRARSVAQALRPYPQYQGISTGVQNGDKSGHSSYHALVIKAERRFSQGMTFQWNYTFSKLLTDSDTYFANNGSAQDHYNRSLEKSIGQNDQTHQLKLSTLWEMPFGRGKRWLSSGVLSHVLGGWRISAIQIYSSGYPVALSRNNPLPLFNGSTRPVVNSYDNWRPAVKGDKFDPAVDLFLDRSVFPAQPAHIFGNATRFNPKVRGFTNKNENISLAKSFNFSESARVELRGEAFNILNRTIFAVPNTNLNNNAFGVVTGQANDPRQMQVALKIYW